MTRQLSNDERDRLASARGVEDLPVTCKGDVGYGPCGTYLDWADGRCDEGHTIEIEEEEEVEQ